MRTINLLLICLGLALRSSAGQIQVNVAWDASSTPDVDGYFLKITTNAPVFVANTNALVPPLLTLTNYTRVDVGMATTATLMLPAGRYWSTVAAKASGGESEDSNVISFQLVEPPGNYRLLIIEAAVDLSGSNWTQVGFVRVKVP
jgi:hypothetical protein